MTNEPSGAPPGRRRALRIAVAVAVLAWSWIAFASAIGAVLCFLQRGGRFSLNGAYELAAASAAIAIAAGAIAASAVSSLAGGRVTRILATVGWTAGALTAAIFPVLLGLHTSTAPHAAVFQKAAIAAFAPLIPWVLVLWRPFGNRFSARGGLPPVPRRIWLWVTLLVSSIGPALAGTALILGALIAALHSSQSLTHAGRSIVGGRALFATCVVAWLSASLGLVVAWGHARKSHWARRLQSVAGPVLALLLLISIAVVSGADGWGVLAGPGHAPMAAWTLIVASTSVLLMLGGSYGSLSGPTLAGIVGVAGVLLAWHLPEPRAYGARPKAGESEPPPVAPLAPSRPEDPCKRAAELEARVAQLLEQGRLDRAQRVLERAVSLCDEGAETRNAKRLEVLMSLGAFERARELASASTSPSEADLRARIEACPPDRNTDVELADRALEADRLAEALAGYERAFTTCLRDPQTLAKAARVARALEREPDAQRWFDRALAAAETRHGGSPRPALLKPFHPNASIVWGDEPNLLVIDDDVRVFQAGSLRDRALLDARPSADIEAPPAWSGDGRFVAAVSGRMLRIMDTRTAIVQPVVELADGSRLRVAVSRDGTQLATLGGGWLDVWEAAKRHRLAHWKLDDETPGDALAFVPGANQVVATSAGAHILADISRPEEPVGTTKVGLTAGARLSCGGAWFSSVSGRSISIGPMPPKDELTLIESPDFEPKWFALASDGARLAIAPGSAPQIQVWDVRGRRMLSKFDGEVGSQISSIAISRDGSAVAVGFAAGQAGVWKADRGEVIANLKGHTSEVSSLRFSPDGKRIATIDRSGTLRVFDVTEGKMLLERSPLLPERAVAFAASADGSMLVLGGVTGSLFAWNTVEGTIGSLPKAPGTVGAASLSRDGSDLLVASEQEVAFLDPRAGRVLRTSQPGTAHLGVSLDRAWYAVQREGGAVVRNSRNDTTAFEIRSGGPKACGSVVFSSDGKAVAASGGDGIVRIRRDKPVPLVRGVEQLPWNTGCSALAFSPDDHFLAVGTAESLLLWDIESSSVRWEAPAPRGVQSVAFSPDGALLVTTARLDGVRIWETASGLQHTQAWPDDDARMASFLPGGRRVAWTGEVGGLRLAGADKGAPVGSLLALLDGKAGLCIASNGTAAVVGDAKAITSRMSCAIGSARLPFEVCAERLLRPTLVHELLTGDDAWLEP